MGDYPQLEININHLIHNTKVIKEKCEEFGITVTGVFKGISGDLKVAEAFLKGGLTSLASSRLEQIEAARNAKLEAYMILIRIPMISEAYDVVRLSDCSLQSEIEVIKELNKEAEKQHKVHDIILMADVGDLREGYWDYDELDDVAYYIENNLKNIHLKGVGTNVGCYGSVAATKETLEKLISIAENVERRIGRKLEIISGGASSSLLRIWDKDMPSRINHLRVGEAIILPQDLEWHYGYDMSEMYKDCFRLKAEVIEVKNKPSHPVGTLSVDAFGHTPTYIDRGIRKRMLLGLGRADYSMLEELLPMDEGLELIGASSDHTICDIENAKKEYKVGDIVEFDMNYAILLFVSNSKNVKVKYLI